MEEGNNHQDMSETFDSNNSIKTKPSSRYKGVVPQQNGHWGAQIYANQTRTWLGTFKTEDMAGLAYDSAAIKLRHSNSSDLHRNFPLNDDTCHEPAFQSHYSVDQVLNMIRDGSYQTKFSEYLSIVQDNGARLHSISQNKNNNNNGGCVWKELFRKELTPSDVGKLNRLVIPKRYALKYFGAVQEGSNGGGFDLPFFDKTMKSWKFKYCYWQSSSSFVFTKGWNGFVKVNCLKAKDIVVFYNYELRENNNLVNKFYMIDILVSNATTSVDHHGSCSSTRGNNLEENVDELQANNVGNNEGNNKSFKLFGVEISPQSCNRNM